MTRVGGRLGLGGLSLAAIVITLPATAASADTLRDAFVAVYAGNPTLTGARAGLRATDETVNQARAQGLPSATVTGTYSDYVKPSLNQVPSPKRSFDGNGQVNVPIFQSGLTHFSVAAAKARVEQGRASLQSTEGMVFTDTVTAYMDVIRDTEIVDLNASNVKVLDTNLQASKDRFQVGDLTRTDVAQSQARLADARSQLQAAQAQLDASRQTYLQIVGKFPDNLQPPPPLPALPESSDDALEVAVSDNPDLAAAKKAVVAAQGDIGVARSQRLPKLSAFGQADYFNYFGTLGNAFVGIHDPDRQVTVGVQATMPLYQGGALSSKVRQAQAQKSQAIEQQTATERSVIAQVRIAFARYEAALGVIQSSQVAVSANQLALEGTRAEQSVGTRNLLDVLNAEQELLNSRSALVSAQRDAYVAGFTLIAAMGRAQAKYLGLDGGTLYDPVANYKRVHGDIFDWGSDPKPKPVAPSTIGQPSVSAVVPMDQVTVPQK